VAPKGLDPGLALLSLPRGDAVGDSDAVRMSECAAAATASFVLPPDVEVSAVRFKGDVGRRCGDSNEELAPPPAPAPAPVTGNKGGKPPLVRRDLLA
jgi:hypothetical protein